MTDEKINALINRRNKLTNRRDGLTDSKRIQRIDAQLSQTPPGQRNDVDLLLGRTCAILPPRSALRCAAAQVGVKAEWLTPKEVAMLEARTAECSGIVEHDDVTAGMWK